jgi:hypothetical protein
MTHLEERKSDVYGMSWKKRGNRGKEGGRGPEMMLLEPSWSPSVLRALGQGLLNPDTT